MLGHRPPGLEFRILCLEDMSFQSSHHPQEVLLAQFSLYVHKGGLKSFRIIRNLGITSAGSGPFCFFRSLIVMCIICGVFATVTVLRGTHWVP